MFSFIFLYRGDRSVVVSATTALRCHRRRATAKLPPPSCRRQAATAKLPPPPRHRQAAATVALGGSAAGEAATVQ